MNKVDYFLPLLPYPSLYYIPHYNFLYYSTHLYCPFILFHNIHSLLQSFPFLYLIPSYSSSPYYISFYYTPFIIFPLTPSTQLLSPFPISPLLYSPLALSILLYSPSITLILQPIQILLSLSQPKITLLLFLLSHHQKSLKSRQSFYLLLYYIQSYHSKLIFFPFPSSPEYPFLLLLHPLPHSHLSLKKILPHIHNLYHFTSHIYSLLNITFILFYLTLLTLNLIFHFISFQSFFLSYSLIYLTSLITPHLYTIYFHLNPSESHFNPFKFPLHTSTQSQVLTIIYVLTKLTTDNHPNNHHTY